MTLRLAVAPELAPPGNWLRDAWTASGVDVGPPDRLDDVVGAVASGAADLGLVPAGRVPDHAFTVTRATGAVQVVAVLPRHDPRDVLVAGGTPGRSLTTLGSGATVGLQGARRRALLAVHRPDLQVVPLGNGHTPAAALTEGRVDAVVVGAAEARDAGLADDATEVLDPKIWLPGPGQGAVCVVARAGAGDPRASEVRVAGRAVDDTGARAALVAERAVAPALTGADGGAPPALGVLALPYGRWLRVWAMLPDGAARRLVRADVSGPDDGPAALGRAAGDLLLARGAGYLLP